MDDHHPIDKSTWGEGPWQTEPDRAEWTHAGLPCLAVRNHHGSWCGYAAVAPGHPAHGGRYSDLDLDVHGGLTYAGACQGAVCHVPAPGEPDDVWWFGFDCGHVFDLMPAYASHEGFLRGGLPAVYRTLDYVHAETNKLADQLAAMPQETAHDVTE